MMREGGRNLLVSVVVATCPGVASELSLPSELSMWSAGEVMHDRAEDLTYTRDSNDIRYFQPLEGVVKVVQGYG